MAIPLFIHAIIIIIIIPCLWSSFLFQPPLRRPKPPHLPFHPSLFPSQLLPRPQCLPLFCLPFIFFVIASLLACFFLMRSSRLASGVRKEAFSSMGCPSQSCRRFCAKAISESRVDWAWRSASRRAGSGFGGVGVFRGSFWGRWLLILMRQMSKEEATSQDR